MSIYQLLFFSKKYNIDTKRTMSIAQKLYEAGHITYMRTDSTSISDEAKKSIKNVIESEYGIEYYEKHDSFWNSMSLLGNTLLFAFVVIEWIICSFYRTDGFMA
jgi:hypothetical protein